MRSRWARSWEGSCCSMPTSSRGPSRTASRSRTDPLGLRGTIPEAHLERAPATIPRARERAASRHWSRSLGSGELLQRLLDLAPVALFLGVFLHLDERHLAVLVHDHRRAMADEGHA